MPLNAVAELVDQVLGLREALTRGVCERLIIAIGIGLADEVVGLVVQPVGVQVADRGLGALDDFDRRGPVLQQVLAARATVAYERLHEYQQQPDGDLKFVEKSVWSPGSPTRPAPRARTSWRAGFTGSGARSSCTATSCSARRCCSAVTRCARTRMEAHLAGHGHPGRTRRTEGRATRGLVRWLAGQMC